MFLNGVSGVKSPGFKVENVLPRLGDEAVAVIDAHADPQQPLFLYLPLNSPHLPAAPSDESKGKSQAGTYGDFVWETDQVVGRVLEALEKRGMAENTLVIFTSDNGGLWHWWDFAADDDGGNYRPTPRGEYVKQFGHQSNADWRGTKADIYEGGHRVPFIVRWPARITAGRTSDAVVELTDIVATVAEITEQATLGEAGMDSFSFLPILDGKQEATRPFAVHHSISGVFALRQGSWKMVEGRGSGGFTQPKQIPIQPGEPKGQLYDLSSDPREQKNRWHSKPDRVTRMQQLLEQVRQSSARSAAEAP
jgi:arylsulfatase A-like enzyme